MGKYALKIWNENKKKYGKRKTENYDLLVIDNWLPLSIIVSQFINSNGNVQNKHVYWNFIILLIKKI